MARRRTRGTIRYRDFVPYEDGRKDPIPLPSGERPDTEPPIDLPVSPAELHQALRELTEKQRFVLLRRAGLLGNGMYSYRQIADAMGVSRNAVVQHEKAAINRIRKVVEAKNTCTPLYRVRASFAKDKTHVQRRIGREGKQA